jgi:hypothetical protein
MLIAVQTSLRTKLLNLYAALLKNCALHKHASKRPQSAQTGYCSATKSLDFSAQ